MTRALLLITALLTLTPLAAQAEQPARLSDASYIAAARCLAYADLPQLQSNGADYAALRTAYMNNDARPDWIRENASDAARTIRIRAQRIGANEAGLVTLRQSRSDTCAPFVQSGLVQADSAPHA